VVCDAVGLQQGSSNKKQGESDVIAVQEGSPCRCVPGSRQAAHARPRHCLADKSPCCLPHHSWSPAHARLQTVPEMPAPCEPTEMVLISIVATGCACSRRPVCSHAHLSSCFEGRGISASMPKYFQSAAGSRSCTAGEIVILDMSAPAVLQAIGQCGLRKPRGLSVCAGLVHGRAAITNDDLRTPEALTHAARHREARCT
jgi:hypothetical protein